MGKSIRIGIEGTMMSIAVFFFLILLSLATAAYLISGITVFFKEFRHRKELKKGIFLAEGEGWLAQPLMILIASFLLPAITICDIVLIFSGNYLTQRAAAIIRFDSILVLFALLLILATRHPFQSFVPDSYSYLLLAPSVFFVVFALNPRMELSFFMTEEFGLRVLFKSIPCRLAGLWIVLCYAGIVASLIINYIRIPAQLSIREHLLFLFILLIVSGGILLFLYQDIIGLSLFSFRNEFPVAEIFAFFPMFEYLRFRLNRKEIAEEYEEYEEWLKFQKGRAEQDKTTDLVESSSLRESEDKKHFYNSSSSLSSSSSSQTDENTSLSGIKEPNHVSDNSFAGESVDGTKKKVLRRKVKGVKSTDNEDLERMNDKGVA
ncbi:MAG: hypothetical protein QW728_04870 [Thermoplasmata archaeon]